MRKVEITLILLMAMAITPLAQQRSSPPASRPQMFERVSVRRNLTSDVGSNIIDRADGGFTMLNVPVTALLARAYAPALAGDMVNLPRWALVERYDISTTSASANPTAAQRKEMLQAMLADRFKLAVHSESREQPSYDLVLARADRHLGPDIKPSALDCDANPAAGRPAAAAAPAGRGSLGRGAVAAAVSSSCALIATGPRLTGDTTMVGLASTLRASVGRPVIDKTGLEGSYHIEMSVNSPAPPQTATDTPAVLPALEERLGLKLVPSMTKSEVLVIDRLERPSGN